jgi:hypothetical protein
MKITIDQALKALLLQMPFTQEQLKLSYKNAARKAHPDMGGTHEGAILVNAAYETLGSYVGRSSSRCLDNLPETAADFDKWWSDFQKESEEKYRSGYYQSEEYRQSQRRKKQPPTAEEKEERRRTRQRNSFIKAWREFYSTLLKKCRENPVFLPDLGKELDDWITKQSKELENFDYSWHRSLYKSPVSKLEMSEYFGFLFQVAYGKDTQARVQWAKGHFELEFGKEHADKIDWLDQFSTLEFSYKKAMKRAKTKTKKTASNETKLESFPYLWKTEIKTTEQLHQFFGSYFAEDK